MKAILLAVSALAAAGSLAPAAQAADLDGYEGGYVDRGPVVERRYYEYDEAPVVTYYAPRVYRPYPYYAGYYPYGYYGRPYWRAHGYWGGRGGYWGHRGHWGDHRGWR
ncbi:hypothetical protein [Hyphomicrobium sp.]|uniref:hypothetical protein n=1 Tax=Hyphomicrobium sp. TaxID=82 RepID=UPI000FC03947|nr:hypothetical protein [Hyphomicrobium sp.]RUO97780.1 MAG: hypothetical protein EKK30_13650 [Hyphomicrobium sp.]